MKSNITKGQQRVNDGLLKNNFMNARYVLTFVLAPTTNEKINKTIDFAGINQRVTGRSHCARESTSVV